MWLHCGTFCTRYETFWKFAIGSSRAAMLALMRIIPCLGLDRLSNHPKRSSFLRLQSIYLPALPSIEDKGKKPSWLQIEHKSLMLMFGLLTNRKAEGVLTY